MSVLDDLMATREVLLKPEAWTQWKLAIDSAGNGVAAKSPDAVRWCLIGAIARVTDWPDRVWPRWQAVVEILWLALGQHTGLSGWNDAPGRTHAEVLALIDKAILSCR